MDANEPDTRLSRIRTQWTEVFEALAADDPTNAARNALVQRYLGAVYRYLLGAVRDPDVASDLAQEFAVRFLRGDFRRVCPERGRFRDYVRTVLVNLVNDSYRARAGSPLHLTEHGAMAPVAPDVPPNADDEFRSSWREELLLQTWESLRRDNPTFHAMLLLRVEEPDLTSAAMAERLSVQLGRAISADNVRKTLGRAQGKFSELLFEEVASSLEEPTAEELEQELQSLDLLRFCRTAWELRKGKFPCR